jgi:hypothetical protein
VDYKNDGDDEDDCLLTLSQEAHSKNLVDHATSLITEMKIVNEQLEKVGLKIKEMQKDVDRGSKSMMYNLEQKIQIHLREKRNLYRGGGESKGLGSANELSQYAMQSSNYLQSMRSALSLMHGNLQQVMDVKIPRA